ncbi:PEP-CTERM/exosortase system-associated acyltransferase [Alteromonas sp. RKMC-009]|uniref:PEP-CTERM/exosortase system-associated acyltransferase n=1 Tax=Alteromonas sp. RKMC-009 TaxID=2267264 RepID=UPI000C582D6B|nr:PEP-CTERM/exosortase system-associated acyltransferase [Alteromonas sp. RKMC-009]AYA65184.1 PEP-CTERM/exosortase system-associated acyltransferase [Alteromonas sp. RKMC-009]MBT81932.1 GNAT family N-acetyltransferase [Alteromonadaceae bacterium]MEC7691895.1 PEP-CTERM/exosortase system-associated acyltransferase [Pseudomonadota bacterium]
MAKRSIFDTINKKFRRTSVGKMFSGYQQLREANYISSHFSTYLEPVLAVDDALRESVYKIRHNVYCDELAFEPVKESGLETDEFDAYSRHCMIRHIGTQQMAGTVRAVRPLQDDQLLPIEKYCRSSITRNDLSPDNFKRHEVCEISRLAVPKYFRRRRSDDFDGSATGAINPVTYSETELRCFPFIAVGLYFAAAASALEFGVKHAYVMMEPRLARSMGYVGIKFQQIGPVVDYHGKRAPYYINRPLLEGSLKPGFASMLNEIRLSLREQIPAMPEEREEYLRQFIKD